MVKLINLVSEIEEIGLFDMDKIARDYKYYPFYDDLVEYCKSKNVAINYGITHFDWNGDISKNEAIELLKKKYKKYIVYNS